MTTSAKILTSTLILVVAGISALHQLSKDSTPVVVKKTAEVDPIPEQLAGVQQAFSEIQRREVPESDPVSSWGRDRMEKALADEMDTSTSDLRKILAAGKASEDPLLQAQALLASGETDPAWEKFGLVISREPRGSGITSIRGSMAYAGRAQIEFGKADMMAALSLQEKAAALVDKESDPIEWADANRELAMISMYAGIMSRGKTLFPEILAINESNRGADHIRTAVALRECFAFSDGEGEKEQSARRALSIAEAHYGIGHRKTSVYIESLAGRLWAGDQLEPEDQLEIEDQLEVGERMKEAKHLYARLLEIEETDYGGGQKYKHVARDFRTLAWILLDRELPVEAEGLMKRAVSFSFMLASLDARKAPDAATNMGHYLQLARELKVTDGKIHSRLEALQKKTGLPQATFDEWWAEALRNNPVK